MKRFWNKLTGEERLCRAEQKLTILILDCQDEERRVKLIRRKKEVHLKRLKIRRRNYIFALILACMMLILAVYGGVRVIGKMIKNVPSGQKQTEQPAESETQTETEDTTRINLTLNFTGDCILGTDEQFAWDTGFNAYYEANGPEYFLKNVRDIFEKDDLTIINMEGTLTEETTRADKQFAFKGDPEFVKILTSSSVEAANMANNHSHDYGEQSFQNIEKMSEKIQAVNITQVFRYSVRYAVVAAEWFSVLFVIFVAVLLIIKDYDEICQKLQKYSTFRHLVRIGERLWQMAGLWLRAQLLIMAAVMAECVAGLWVLQNSYALLVGILIGFLDALPFIGTGTILLPWAALELFRGDFFHAAAYLTFFLITNSTRDFLEPRLLGEKLGVYPIVIAVVVYVGICIFGPTGVLLGPLMLLVIREVVREWLEA